jgi:DNA-binding transcriptional LysR family regulator
MRGSEFAELRAFVSIVQQRSFVRAAALLAVSPSALSQTLRGLEERLGVRLLNRTTRSVAPTEAGQRLFERVGPTLLELDSAVADVRSTGDAAKGQLRINSARQPGIGLLGPMLGRFHAAYPDVVLDVVLEDSLTDIVAGRFDAGIRLGECLERDMVALKLSEPLCMAAVAAPAYFERHGVPEAPRDLHRHRCINWRRPTDGSLYRWEFQRKGRQLEVAVGGPLIVNDAALALRAALDGVGIAYIFDEEAAPWLARGALQRVLEPWSPSFPGFYLYYPSRRHTPAPLAAFIEFLRRERHSRPEKLNPGSVRKRRSTRVG